MPDTVPVSGDLGKIASAVTGAGPSAGAILHAVGGLFKDRVGSALWVNVLAGGIDKGSFLQVYKRDRWSADLLLGHKTAGAALGYDFATLGPISASVFAGAAHPYDGLLTHGWTPVAGVGIKF